MDKKTEYAQKLLDPRWQKKRLKILERDGFRCKLCGDEKTTLHIHHKKYSGEPWEVDDEDLDSVCKDCHKLLEALKKRSVDLLVVNTVKHKIDDKHICFIFKCKSAKANTTEAICLYDTDVDSFLPIGSIAMGRNETIKFYNRYKEMKDGK